MSAQRLYIAGKGMVTGLGPNVAITRAVLATGMSAYQESPYYTPQGAPIVMSEVPPEVFQEFDAEIEECGGYNEQYDNIIKMAILAINEACAHCDITAPIPLVLGMAELALQEDSLPSSLLVGNLASNCPMWVSPKITRSLQTGRAAGIDAIDFAFNYLSDATYDFLLVGGSDSHSHYSRLNPLADAGRLLTSGSADSFAPGEGASFLLLTCKPELAQVCDGHIIALHPPGMADELGHLYSDEPYRGDGLDKAFKQALYQQPAGSVGRVYSSMNGESHWAKEYGVAFLRNSKAFADPVELEHPADSYGDLGAAASTALITLAAEHLLGSKSEKKCLICSSSDTARRGAIVIEKLSAI